MSSARIITSTRLEPK